MLIVVHGRHAVDHAAHAGHHAVETHGALIGVVRTGATGSTWTAAAGYVDIFDDGLRIARSRGRRGRRELVDRSRLLRRSVVGVVDGKGFDGR